MAIPIIAAAAAVLVAGGLTAAGIAESKREKMEQEAEEQKKAAEARAPESRAEEQAFPKAQRATDLEAVAARARRRQISRTAAAKEFIRQHGLSIDTARLVSLATNESPFVKDATGQLATREISELPSAVPDEIVALGKRLEQMNALKQLVEREMDASPAMSS